MLKSFSIILLLALSSAAPVLAEEVVVLGLFKNAAFLEVDGSGKLVRVGETYRGVDLLSADSWVARLRVGGAEYDVGVSQRISAVYTEREMTRVLIPRSRNLQYLTTLSINGRSAQGLVDTGANVMALSARQADALGIAYLGTVTRKLTTASGTVRAYSVRLESVEVGGILVRNVAASVLEGSHPQQVLIGMSFLEHVEMSEKAGVLSLIKK
ncbi:TIGR02281 family clan AA aspartic protease [Halieaceae bacterium IMCC14734]|uniref:TIGR02281 family clan AA aspartic protease n=1 Tax=Candidatus Litorirhabdus singularis TaxID=2518993 RepID=A0ABT3TKE8_9GAMM|nr:retropepsin-like aspartic protease [Candidatus Litorirhabdus singularis]MCX2982779.1 TIGR02281 family clan AA aspartic protease [Candidatus Litorirhabdus singularis]